MPRLVIKTKKRRSPTGELSRLKEQLRRLTEQLTSRDRELAEAAATGTNLQSVMDAIAQNAAELCDAVDAVVWRVDARQARRCKLWIDTMRQVQEEDDEIDRAFTLATP
jgi:hypothetical protein